MVLNVATNINAFMPVFSFLLVFAVVYGLLSKTEILGKNRMIHLLVSFVVAIIFLASTATVQYTKVATSWFAAFMITLLFIILLVGLVHGKVEEVLNKNFAWFIVVVLLVVFIFSAIHIFQGQIGTYFSKETSFFLSPTVIGIVILIGITVFISWLITRDKK
jgi:hypothetical protein